MKRQDVQKTNQLHCRFPLRKLTDISLLLEMNKMFLCVIMFAPGKTYMMMVHLIKKTILKVIKAFLKQTAWAVFRNITQKYTKNTTLKKWSSGDIGIMSHFWFSV